MRTLVAKILILPVLVAIAFAVCYSDIPGCKEQHKKDKQGSSSAYLIDVTATKSSDGDKGHRSAAESADRCSALCLFVTRTTEDPVAAFTLVLSFVAWLQFIWMTRQENVLIESVKAAERSAEAAVKTAIPVLYPYVTEMSKLHPLNKSDAPITHDANIFIAFDNYGKTPGIIRQIRAQLFLTEKDQLPRVDVDKLEPHPYSVIVPGETRGKDITTGALDLKQTITLNPTELSELLSEAKGNFRRFALIGKVIYDDFFGNRHTSCFCVKLRSWVAPIYDGGVVTHVFRAFQVAHGGSRYNKVTSEQIPKPDPFTEI